MAAKKSAAAKTETTTRAEGIVSIMEVTRKVVTFHIVGDTPLLLNRVSEKARRELLMPRGRLSQAEKATHLKHNPMEEFRDAPYKLATGPTYLGILPTSFKKAMSTSALDLPGASKAQIGRLVYVLGDYIHIYGVPELFMSIVRSADMKRTPDVRTRVALREWACTLNVSMVQPLVKPNAVANLLAAAGMTVGVGDWRGEKGSGNYGMFHVADEDDADLKRIMKNGRTVQEEAMRNPTAFDDETADLLTWFNEELVNRHAKGKGAVVEEMFVEPETVDDEETVV